MPHELLELGEWLTICLAGCALTYAMMRKTCPRCHGAKTIYETDGRQIWCPTCKGEGEVEVEE